VQHENRATYRKSPRAAQYVRMSTSHQKYSIANQSDAIAAYAASRSFNIVRTYRDEGRSGLVLQGRDALQQLINDVRSGTADYEFILVYDVSRWGRFQDADESAYYEFVCKKAGVQVLYCAELFENDGSLASTLLKHMRRGIFLPKCLWVSAASLNWAFGTAVQRVTGFAATSLTNTVRRKRSLNTGSRNFCRVIVLSSSPARLLKCRRSSAFSINSC
jgi:hypothetical protein